MVFQNVCRLCRKKNISIAKLEREVGIGNGTIGKWDKSSPTAEKLKRVADYFGVSVDSLLTAREEMENVESYRTWRDDLAKSGKTPEELLAQYEAAGMTDYVKQVRAVIQQMEGLA